jgi:hypothetical protein
MVNERWLVMTRARVFFLLAVLSLGGCAEHAAETAFATAWQLDTAGAGAESVRAWSDFVDRFADSPLAPIATQRLAALSGRPAAADPPRVLADGDYVCSAPGLYAHDARWCGWVRSGAEPWYLVELGSIQLKTIWAFGFRSSTCTGNRFLSYFSYGERIWIPRSCIETPP